MGPMLPNCLDFKVNAPNAFIGTIFANYKLRNEVVRCHCLTLSHLSSDTQKRIINISLSTLTALEA
jgi:hypothetical protein